MSVVKLYVERRAAVPPPCSWCGLRESCCQVAASPTCAECRDGGRKFRVRMYQQRLRRAAGSAE